MKTASNISKWRNARKIGESEYQYEKKIAGNRKAINGENQYQA